MKKIILPLSLLLIFAVGCGETHTDDQAVQPESAQIFAMDTVMDLTVYGDGAQAALSAAKDEINRLDGLLSRQKADSEISAINNAAGAPYTADSEVYSLIADALRYGAATDGALDITVAPIMDLWNFTGDAPHIPTQAELDTLLPLVGSDRIVLDKSKSTVALGAKQSIDLGAIAKGYTSDRIAAIWKELGITSGVASLGGNVYALGTKPDGSAWRVAVKDPLDTESYVGILSVSDKFVITSGGYQRYFEQDGKVYHHIIDPKTGISAENGLVSATIIADNGTMCDAFSTALFVLGEDKAIDFWRSGGYDFDMILVTDDNRVLVTDGISDVCNTTESEGKYEVQVLTKG